MKTRLFPYLLVGLVAMFLAVGVFKEQINNASPFVQIGVWAVTVVLCIVILIVATSDTKFFMRKKGVIKKYPPKSI